MPRVGRHQTPRQHRQGVIHPRVYWLVLTGVLCLVPITLWAQPFDLARARRAVVRVIADGGNSIGSGSIIKIDGGEAYILTAYHVIQQDVLKSVSQVRVELFTEEVLEARISGSVSILPMTSPYS